MLPTIPSHGEDLLDDADAIRAADTSGAVLGAATGGGQIRAVATAVRSGALDGLRGARPRAVVWVVGRSSQAAAAARIVTSVLASHQQFPGFPVVIEHRIPAWVGALDVVVVSGADAGDPVQAEAIEVARKRGADVLCDLPKEGPAAHVGESGVSWIEPLAFVAPERAILRHLAVGFALFSALGVSGIDIEAAADVVDERLSANGPELAVPVNPAKLLAREVAESSAPQIVFEDEVAGAIAGRVAQAFTESGRPTTTSPLADALRMNPVLAAKDSGPAGAADDIFHDEFIDGPKHSGLRPTYFGLALAVSAERVAHLAAGLGVVSWIDMREAGQESVDRDPSAPAQELSFDELVVESMALSACCELAAAYALVAA